MHISLKTINVGTGDCIVFQLSNANDKFNILIDCGEYNANVESCIKKLFCKHIDLLIATHIDDDHIRGLANMLTTEDMKDLYIGNIWYNCYQHVSKNNVHFTPELKTKIEYLHTKLNTKIVKNEDIGKEKAKMLALQILSNHSWSEKWNKEIIKKGYIFQLSEGKWGIIKVIAPSESEWDKKKEDFINYFCSELLEDKWVDFDESPYLYELLNRLMEYEKSHIPFAQDTGYTELSKHSIQSYADEHYTKDCSLNNRSSISFVWEKEGHRILFPGDTSAENIINGLKDLYQNEKKIIFDAIKIPHHGSEHNVNKELLEYIDSSRYIIPGVKEDKRPSLQTLSRIINRPLPKDNDGNQLFTKRLIYCNAITEHMKPFINADSALKKEFNFEFIINDINECYEEDI